MKKHILLFISLFMLIPTIVLADTHVQDLKDTIESIGLTFQNPDYRESNDQATVYLFRMTTCDHCHDAITWFNDIATEYGAKFKMRSFEVTSNQDNNTLYKNTAAYLGLKEGVPLIIIGNHHFRGFGESSKTKIIEAIEEIYENKDKYDIFDEMEKNPEPIKKEEKNEDVTKQIPLLPIGIGLLVIAIIVLIIFIIKK